MSRPTKYDEKKHIQLARLCVLAGMTDDEIAEEFEIDRATLYRWKNKHKKFRDVLKENKEIHDSRVEATLLKKALGYEYYEEYSTKTGIELLKKVQHPDTTSMIFWLKNRQPEKWREKQEIEHTGKDLKINFILDKEK